MKKLLSLLLFTTFCLSIGGCTDNPQERKDYGSSNHIISYTGNVEDCSHEYGSWELLVEPKCEEDGLKGRTCNKCGHQDTVILPASGHEFHDGICTLCGAEEDSSN